MELPVELYRPVVENITDIYDLRSLLLTSRALYFEALRLIYYDAEITYTRDEDDINRGPAFRVIQPSDSHPLHYPLLLGPDQNRIVQGPGAAHPVDVSTFLNRLNIRLDNTKAWIGPVLEAAVNLKWLGLVRLRDYMTFGPVDPSQIDERGLPFSALVGLRPRFRLDTFITNLPGDEHMHRFLLEQDDITTFSWLPPVEYPVQQNLFDSTPLLLPKLEKLSFNETTEFMIQQTGRPITHVEYMGFYFLKSVRTWQGLQNLVVLRVAGPQTAFNEIHNQSMGMYNLPLLEYLDCPGYLVSISRPRIFHMTDNTLCSTVSGPISPPSVATVPTS